MDAYIAQISLDLNVENNFKLVKVKQGDAVLRQIAITLLKDGMPYTPANVTASKFRVQKSDGNIVVLESTDSPSMISVSGGIYTVTLTEQCLAAAGKAVCDLDLVYANGNVSTANFVMDVVPMPIGPEIESTTVWADMENAVDAAEESAELAATFVGAPLQAETVAEMDDVTRIYVYTGTEEGYIFGNWYYFDGTEWSSGGVYNSIAVDVITTAQIDALFT